MIKRHFAYGKYVITHKWFVTIECFKTRLFWRGLVHDLDKFRPRQWIPYARFFYESDGTKKIVRDKTGFYKPYNTGNIEFDLAVKRHCQSHTHHWQHWTFPKDEEGLRIFDIPDEDIIEMICDWRGAGRAQGVENWQDPTAWFKINANKMQLSSNTKWIIEMFLFEIHNGDKKWWK